jgi:hypothetical protein
VTNRAQHGIGPAERGGIEVREGGEIMVQKGGCQIGRHVAAGIFQQGYEIVADRPDAGILEVEQAAGRRIGPVRQADQVVDVIVAQ